MSASTSVTEMIPFDLLVEENEAGILYLENENILYCNKKFSTVIHEKLENIKGKSIIHFIHVDDKVKLQKEIEELVLGNKELVSSNFLINHAEKDEDYISLHLKVVKRLEGTAMIAGASRSATARVTNLAKLNESELLKNALFDNIHSGIMIYNYNEEKTVEVNPSALKIFGYDDPNSLINKTRLEFVPQFSKYFPGADLHELTKEHGDMIRSGEAFNVPGVFVGKDNKEIIVRANLVPTERSAGEAFIFFNDVTKNFFANQKIRDTEKKYRDIIENVLEGIVYLDAKSGMPIFCNEVILQIFGVKDLEEFGKLRPNSFIDEEQIDGLNPEDYYAKKILIALQQGKSEVEFWLRKKSGERIRVSGAVLRNSKKKEKPTVICFFRDITTLHKARVKLSENNIELKKYIDSNLQLENFAYFASHDLQTPLRSIISFTQLLNKKLADKITVEEQEYMDFIIMSSLNMKNLVTDILSYSQVNSKEISLSKVNLSQILTELISEFKNDSNEKQAAIVIHDTPKNIVADRTKLRQVFSNLISNAVKFTDKETKPEISIRGEEHQNHWLFSVKDNGIGIEKEFQDVIFLLFKSLHPKSEYKGTGIGLALVKKIVEQHQGKIWIESELGKGTVFYFTIEKFDDPQKYR